MARTKAQGRKAKSAGREVYVEGKKAAAERKKVKAKIKAKGKAKHAAKLAKEEKKRLAREAPDNDAVDDGFIEFTADEEDQRKQSKKKEDSREEEKRVLQLESRPWMRQRKGYANRNVYECLHDEIMDFVTFISPTEDELRSRAQLVEEMRGVVKGLWPEATVETFGSHYTQMFLPQSDIDMVLFGVPEGKEPLYKLAQCLEEKDRVSYLEVIDKARIPIVKMVHKGSDIHVDVSFNVAGGLATGDLVKHYMRVYPSFRPLTLVLKYFMAQRGLNETYSGGVGSFLLQMMVVSFLQHHGRALGAEHDDPKFNNLGQLLMGFFTLYGRDFNYTDLAVSVRNGGSYFPKEKRRWYDDGRPFLIAMENPNEPSLDIGKNSYEMRTVKRSFDYARQVLQNEIYRHGQFNTLPGSILGTIIQPDSNLVKREPPESFGYDILHHDPVKTAEIRKQYEMRRDEEASKKRAVEAAKNIRQSGTNEPPYKRWRGRNRAY
ncbi:Poly(A) RNA polymerase, putative [Phytophthora infestans T30-4]|uniref:Poly(A) RNA polymerase, putative n=2 Tax=Phytophthora infestans TaxID=4787 RepID=D0NY74_PHYIT|nr:Poly(A) RNA polymerase, putative [Phytophthora infestans T30-4]EEY68032.1 Poly(A) RNA polymerase, putative [Phytophthora infestans T30-4]KAF4038878.1 Cid1 family poly A polymerase [Phytophthora infestans]KAF4143560.1 Cid1 family poly A polymerase [Phytophthora infestans]|eukprot:XP_002997731.1 Poly(A) RNA polymerase, putative [Phytophthora infestans T30-4]